MTIKEAKYMIGEIVLNKHLNEFHWEDDVLTDGEVEYQLRSAGCSKHLNSVLVRFCEDRTHTYREFFTYDVDNMYDFFYEIFADSLLDELCDQINKKLNIERN